jgi:hypothetical protein
MGESAVFTAAGRQKYKGGLEFQNLGKVGKFLEGEGLWPSLGIYPDTIHPFC